MTKFEEELYNKVKVTNIELTTEAEYKKSTLINHFKNWHSDEEFRELLDKYSNLNDSYEKEVIKSSKLESQIIGLKSQLQQQALPVVPECVAEIIEYAKNNKKSIRWFFTEDAYMFPEAMDWYAGSDKGLVDDIYAERQCSLINAFITGKYQVEKPQLFYIELPNVYGLKNKVSVSKVENGTIVEFSNGKNYALKLTEQEIKSIDERYWQFAVPVEEVE